MSLFSLLSGRAMLSIVASGVAAIIGIWNFSKVTDANTELNRQNQLILLQLDEMKARRQRLIQALDNNTVEKNQLEKNSEILRKSLQKMLEGKLCAGEPVPVDVIRLQREALTGDH